MTPTLHIILQLALWLLLAPLLPGIVNKVKAWVARRKGPPIFQLYYDLYKLWRKGVVMSTLASPGFIVGPAVAWVSIAGAALLLPLGPAGSVLSFRGDVLVFIYLLALARFCTAWAAMETGSAFEGMGSVREVSYAVISETVLITTMLTLIIQTGSITLVTLLEPVAGAGSALLAVGLFTVLLAENCRVPFDDPNTHLELTMIHEAMILEYSGRHLALIEWAASLKLFAYSCLGIALFLPMGIAASAEPLALAVAGLYMVLKLAVGGFILALIETLSAKMRIFRAPEFLGTAFLLGVLAMLVHLLLETGT